jgi:UDP-glucose 4-epimerase
VEYLLQGNDSTVFNLGNGNGFSVKQVIDAAKTVTGKDIKVVEGDRRPGDPPSLVGSGDKARKVLGWQPQYSDLHTIISHAWQWHQQRHEQKAQ